MIAAHLPVDGERLGLDPAHGAEHQDRPVQDAEAALDLDGEIDVAGRIDEVDAGVVPVDRGGGAGDGDAAFLFQFHVVHGGAAAVAVDLLHAMDSPGVIQDPLAQGGLARVDVGGNADITEVCQVHVCRRPRGLSPCPQMPCGIKEPLIIHCWPQPCNRILGPGPGDCPLLKHSARSRPEIYHAKAQRRQAAKEDLGEEGGEVIGESTARRRIRAFPPYCPCLCVLAASRPLREGLRYALGSRQNRFNAAPPPSRAPRR